MNNIKSVTSVDYITPVKDGVFAYDRESPSCLVFNRIVYGGRNNKQHIKKVGDVAGSKEYNNRSGTPLAWRVQYCGIRYNAHRLVWALHYGDIDNTKVIDHLDGNPFNNLIENLQLKSIRENNQNVKLSSRNKSGVCGVFLEYNDEVPIGWTATWSDINGVQNRRRFYLSGENSDIVFADAVAFRQNKIKELVSQSMTYTDRHGR